MIENANNPQKFNYNQGSTLRTTLRIVAVASFLFTAIAGLVIAGHYFPLLATKAGALVPLYAGWGATGFSTFIFLVSLATLKIRLFKLQRQINAHNNTLTTHQCRLTTPTQVVDIDQSEKIKQLNNDIQDLKSQVQQHLSSIKLLKKNTIKNLENEKEKLEQKVSELEKEKQTQISKGEENKKLYLEISQLKEQIEQSKNHKCPEPDHTTCKMSQQLALQNLKDNVEKLEEQVKELEADKTLLNMQLKVAKEKSPKTTTTTVSQPQQSPPKEQVKEEVAPSFFQSIYASLMGKPKENNMEKSIKREQPSPVLEQSITTMINEHQLTDQQMNNNQSILNKLMKMEVIDLDELFGSLSMEKLNQSVAKTTIDLEKSQVGSKEEKKALEKSVHVIATKQTDLLKAEKNEDKALELSINALENSISLHRNVKPEQIKKRTKALSLLEQIKLGKKLREAPKNEKKKEEKGTFFDIMSNKIKVANLCDSLNEDSNEGWEDDDLTNSFVHVAPKKEEPKKEEKKVEQKPQPLNQNLNKSFRLTEEQKEETVLSTALLITALNKRRQGINGNGND